MYEDIGRMQTITNLVNMNESNHFLQDLEESYVHHHPYKRNRKSILQNLSFESKEFNIYDPAFSSDEDSNDYSSSPNLSRV